MAHVAVRGNGPLVDGCMDSPILENIGKLYNCYEMRYSVLGYLDIPLQ